MVKKRILIVCFLLLCISLLKGQGPEGSKELSLKVQVSSDSLEVGDQVQFKIRFLNETDTLVVIGLPGLIFVDPPDNGFVSLDQKPSMFILCRQNNQPELVVLKPGESYHTDFAKELEDNELNEGSNTLRMVYVFQYRNKSKYHRRNFKGNGNTKIYFGRLSSDPFTLHLK